MGMYDYVRCEYPLRVPGANGCVFQTKDTPAQACDNYLIKEDGSLWYETYETEDRSNPELEGIDGFVGCMTRVNERYIPFEFTGEIRFYDFFPDEEWLEFAAVFEDGKLQDIQKIVEADE